MSVSTWKKEQLQQWLDEGKTLEEIGKMKDVSKQRVSQKIKEFGIKPNLPESKVKSKPKCPKCNDRGFIELNHGLVMKACICRKTKVAA